MDKSKIPGYKLPTVICESEYDLMKKLVYLYSCYTVITGENKRPLKPRLVDVLSLYVMLGFNRETKKEVVAMCNMKTEVELNGLNKELRDQKFLVKGKYNQSNNELSEDLKVLKMYFDSSPKDRDLNMHMNLFFGRK